ncbi:MAG: hypothetical protein Fur0043_10390 [Anaerolineales bacterium]
MNKENVYLVILLVVGIVVLSNLFMFALVRGSRAFPFHWFRRGDTFTQPFKGEDASLNELRQRVEDLARGEKSATDEHG